MIPIFTVIFLLLSHYVADFMLQTNWQATNKSKNNLALFNHVASYTAVMMILMFAFKFSMDYAIDVKFAAMCTFGVITFVTHYVLDFISSRITSHFYRREDYHNFFVIIGADQFLHALQIILTYYYIYGA